MANHADFISRYRAQLTTFLTSREDIQALIKQYNADLVASLASGDFTGANIDITLAQFQSAITSMNAIESAIGAGGTLSTGHDTNLYKLKL